MFFFLFFGAVGTGFTSAVLSICRNEPKNYSSEFSTHGFDKLSVPFHQKLINSGASHQNHCNTGDLLVLEVISCNFCLRPSQLHLLLYPTKICHSRNFHWQRSFSFSQTLVINISNAFAIL